jgi:MFS family permease
VVTAYALTLGGFLLLGGRAADLLGRSRLFMAGLAIFTGAWLACALATSDTFQIVMRGIQGLGAAAVLPAALSIVMNMFSEGAERNKALGLWALSALAGRLSAYWPAACSRGVPAGSTSSASTSRPARQSGSRGCSSSRACR